MAKANNNNKGANNKNSKNTKKSLTKVSASPNRGPSVAEQNQVIKGRRPLHPKLKTINLIFPNGDKVEVLSTYGRDIHVDDRHKHPAWNRDRRLFVVDSTIESVADLKNMEDLLSQL